MFRSTTAVPELPTTVSAHPEVRSASEGVRRLRRQIADLERQREGARPWRRGDIQAELEALRVPLVEAEGELSAARVKAERAIAERVAPTFEDLARRAGRHLAELAELAEEERRLREQLIAAGFSHAHPVVGRAFRVRCVVDEARRRGLLTS